MTRGIPSPERRRPGAFLSRGAAALGLLGLLSGEALAWPANLMESLNRDARKLLPKSLARLLARREPQILDGVARFPTQLGQALAEELGNQSSSVLVVLVKLSRLQRAQQIEPAKALLFRL